MQVNDSHRLEVCWSLSAALHIGVFGFYLAQHMQKQEKLTIISEVEFIEPEPLVQEQPQAAEPLQRAPKNVLEFLRMALPTLKPPPSLQDQIKAPDRQKDLMDAPQEKIDLKKGFQNMEPALELNRSAKKSASLTDVAQLERAQKNAPELAEAQLNLDEVGRARVPQAEFEAVELKRGSKSASLQEQALPTTTRQAPRPSTLQDASIQLARSGPSRPAAMPSSEPQIALGYAKRGGGLKESASLPASALPTTPVVKPASTLAPVEVKKKTVEISGPLSSRKIVRSKMPEYPAWARNQGVSADVVLYFFVTPAGQVVDKIRVTQASGYSDLDRLAIEALKSWIFDPVAGSEDQWGYITFRYILE